jgi:hypothetical protein
MGKGKTGGGGKSENVQVIVRLRPMNSKEKARGDKEAVVLDLAANNITVDAGEGAPKTFGFDAVYNNSFSQRDVYLQSIHAVVETVLQGFNATIFAYGQSGTGKTYSMAGVLSDPKQLGIIPNALNHIFDTINNLGNDNMEYSVMASFVELYNGKCRDLLVEGRLNLELKENQQKQFYVKDLSHHVIRTTMDAMGLMDQGLSRREVKSTDLNADSSRSHSLFSVYVRVHDKVNDVKTESKLNLVDLAGSERQKASGATGETLNEGNNINQSLTALGMVIDCLVKQKPHIPYRSSPLTMLLKDGLGGNSRTVIVGTCSPSAEASHETVSSLRFLDRAKQIKNKPTVQMDPKDAKIAELQEEVKQLRARLGLANKDDGGGGDDDDQAKENYIRSFDGEVETLKRRVEELEVQAHLATEAEEAVRSDLRQADAKMAALRHEYEERQQEMVDKARREAEEVALRNATEGQSNDDLDAVVKLCAHFIEAHLDANSDWRVDKKKKQQPGGASVDDIANGLRLLDAGGFEKKVQAALVRRQSLVQLQSPPKPPTKPKEAGMPQRTNGASSPQPTPASGDESPQTPSLDMPPKKKDKKDKKDKKKDKKEKKSGGHDAAMELGLLGSDRVDAILAANSVAVTPAIHAAVQELLEQQRAVMQEATAERLREGSASLDTPEDASQLLVAYEAIQEDLTRTRAQFQKQKQIAGKIKEIADRRAEEADQLKAHVAALREELAAKHAQHAQEFAMQQDQLVTQHNKRTEQLMQKHQKALIKEKKTREKIQEEIKEWEEKFSRLEQDYDVKIMEFEALQQNYEQQKLEQLKKYRDMAQGYSTLGGMSPAAAAAVSVAASNDNERLRRIVARSTAVSSLNTSYNPSANDGRFQSRSAPEPEFPALGVPDPRPPGASPGAANFSRNFLDVPVRRG